MDDRRGSERDETRKVVENEFRNLLKFLAVLAVAVLFFIAVSWVVGVLLDDLH